MKKSFEICDFSKNSIIIATGIIFSRISGFVRDVVFANIFGVGILSDIFFASFKFPNLFRRIFADGGLVISFVPIFSKYIKEDRKSAVNFASSMLSVIITVVSFFVLIMLFFMKKVTYFLNPGFTNEAIEIGTRCSRISIIFLLIAVCNALFGGMLNTISKFFYYAFSTVFFNLGIIICGLLILSGFVKVDAINFMSCSIVIGGFFAMLLMIYGIYRNGLMISVGKINFNKDVRDVLIGIVYTIPSSGMFNVFIDSIFASFFVGGLSYVYYSDRIMNMPISVIGYTIGTLILPMLSKSIIANDKIQTKLIHKKAFFVGMIFSIPIVFILIHFSKNIVDILYYNSKLNDSDLEIVSAILKTYSLAIPAIILSKICTSSYFASRNEKIQFKTSIISVLINISMILLLMDKFGLISMFYATVISCWANCIMNIYYLRTKLIHNFFRLKYFLYLVSIVTISILSINISSLFYHVHFRSFYIQKIYPVFVFLIFYVFISSILFFIFSKKNKINISE